MYHFINFILNYQLLPINNKITETIQLFLQLKFSFPMADVKKYIYVNKIDFRVSSRWYYFEIVHYKKAFGCVSPNNYLLLPNIKFSFICLFRSPNISIHEQNFRISFLKSPINLESCKGKGRMNKLIESPSINWGSFIRFCHISSTRIARYFLA